MQNGQEQRIVNRQTLLLQQTNGIARNGGITGDERLQRSGAGQRLGLDEQEVLDRVRSLKARKIIRRLGANFQSAKLGFVSTLCAAKVSQDKMDAFVAEVNAKPGVTHNYLRAHDYNIWFTLISPSREESQAILDGITKATGVAILNLPATKLFKIRVDFRMNKDS